MTTAKTSGDSGPNRRSDQELDRRYGRIGISALVAALPYRSESKNSRETESDSRGERAA